jgi:putative transposase
MSFIQQHRANWGIEPICRTLQVAPSTYYARRSRGPSLRQQRDQQLKHAIRELWLDNRQVYGADKVWAQLQRAGTHVARCTVERLMRELGLRGVVRGKTFVRTTREAQATPARSPDLVARQFRAAAPNRLWVADVTYVKTHSGWVYVAFISDVFSRFVVGWHVGRSLHEQLTLHALEMALWRRQRRRLDGLVHHSDRGAQYVALRYTQRLTEAGVATSVGSRGDSYDNALAESFHGLYKAELIRHSGPWRDLQHVEHATLTYVHWFNHQRLHGALGMRPPADVEAAYTASTTQAAAALLAASSQ